MSAPHRAVKHELLVRYLDAWASVALRGGRPACFVARCDPALLGAAVRVFAEFADLLRRHPLRVLVLGGAVDPAWPAVPGLSVEAVSFLPTLSGPVFAFFEGQPGDEFAKVASAKLGSALIITDAPIDGVNGASVGCRADLVAADGSTEKLLFTAGTEKALEKFKDELWALDEFAGIRLRDPGDPTLLDIAVRPNIGPLRRMLAAELHHSGPQSVGALRAWTQRSSIYRTTDANTALQAMLAAGDCRREPAAGRLTTTTMIEPGPSPARASGRADRRAAG